MNRGVLALMEIEYVDWIWNSNWNVFGLVVFFCFFVFFNQWEKKHALWKLIEVGKAASFVLY